MTFPSQTDVVVGTVPATTDDRGYVDWPAIIAGIAIASAISIVLLAFGSAIGLGFTDFNAADDVPTIWIAIAAASWLLWVQISSFMAGGYVTGRLRKRHNDATEAESDVRDGAHGLLVWAGALILGAVIAVGGLNAAATTVGNVAGAVTNAASNVAGGAAEGVATDPNAYFTDMLFRPMAVAGAPATDAAATTTAPAADASTTAAAPATDATAATPSTDATAAPAAGATATPAAAPMTAATSASAAPAMSADTSAVRAEAGRIFVQSALGGELPAEDRTYLAQAVAANTGMTQADAEARVDQVVAAMDAAKAKAAEVAEAARKMTVLAAFLTAASLLVSAVGAYWAAQKGGNHRDKNADFSSIFRRW